MNDFTFIYDEIEALMQSTNDLEDPAELHGMMTGFLCVNPEFPFTHWLSEIDFTINQQNERDLLEQLYQQIAEQLARDE